MSTDAAEILRAFVDQVWNEGDFVAGEALFAPGFRHHDLVTHRETDLSGYFDSIRYQRHAFPDIRFELGDIVTDGGRVATRWTVTGVHAESGRHVTVHGMWSDLMAAGRIVENLDGLGSARPPGAARTLLPTRPNGAGLSG